MDGDGGGGSRFVVLSITLQVPRRVEHSSQSMMHSLLFWVVCPTETRFEGFALWAVRGPWAGLQLYSYNTIDGG